MNGDKSNLSASVAARLLNRSRETGEDYQNLLLNYGFERFLYRLGASSVRERFVLKGAMLLRAWSNHPYRATRDLDLLRRGDDSLESIREDLEVVCTLTVKPDGFVFDHKGLSFESIRKDDPYAGTRVVLPASCGKARLRLQIDLGVGDAVWPAPRTSRYTTLLDFPPPEILVYPKEAVVAEKLEAIVVLGDRNSRIKDFFDLYHLAELFEFDRATLVEAVRRTFERRGTPVPSDTPVGLTRAYWENPSRPAQVKAFARRAALTVPELPEDAFYRLLNTFLLPVLQDLRNNETQEKLWPPGGPWP